MFLIGFGEDLEQKSVQIKKAKAEIV